MKTDYLCARTRLKLLYQLYEHYIPQEESSRHQLLELIRFLEQVDKAITTQVLSQGTTSTAQLNDVNEQKEWVLFESAIPAMPLSATASSVLRDSESRAYSIETSPETVAPPGGENENDEMLNVRFFL